MVLFQLFNILLKKELTLKHKLNIKRLLFILHVKKIIFKLFNILLKKVLILKLKIMNKKLLLIMH